jgi:sterol desaturase/sphingolipid hydroxylase (fatty acid hydroxylase superfamily)
MNLASILVNGVRTITAILGAMALVALVEVLVPLQARRRANRDHLGPNLALTFVTFGTNVFFNAGLLLTITWLDARGYGILRWLPLPSWMACALAVVVLDFSFYVAHVAMHKVPALWRFHRVHHSDPVVDVTTTIRQHPGEGIIRYAFMAAFACLFGVGLPGFIVYRTWSAINGLLEHANIRVLPRLDAALALVTTWPNMHKVHHSRDAREANTNYGNIFSWFDRLFGTYTPSQRGKTVICGLDGYDDPELQSTAGLMVMPFRELPRASGGLVLRTEP